MERRLRRTIKIFSLLFSILILVIGTFGCTQSVSVISQADTGDKPTITIASFSGPEAEALSELAPKYTKKTGVKVKFVKLPYSNLFSKGIISTSAQKGLYDLIFIDDPLMPVYAAGKYLYPLSHFNYNPKDKGFVEGALQVTQWPPPEPYSSPPGENGETKYYGLPITGNVSLFFYKKRLAKKYNIDTDNWTWKKVNKIAAEFTKPAKDQYGFVLRGSGGNNTATDFMPVLWSHGGEIFNDDWTSALESPEALAALKEWLKLFDFGPSGQTSFGASEVGAYMENGKAAMAIMWPSGWAQKMPDSVGITMLPGLKINNKVQQDPVIGVWSLGIPKNAPHPDEAFKFLKWITSDKQQYAYATTGSIPVKKSVILDPNLNRKYPFYKKAYKSLQKGRMRPRTPGFSYAQQVLGNEIVAAELGKKTPAQALKDASLQINEYMKEHNLIKK